MLVIACFTSTFMARLIHVAIPPDQVETDCLQLVRPGDRLNVCPHPGFMVDLTAAVCVEAGYVCTISLSETPSYGGRNDNGSWSGILGGIQV